MSTIPTSLTEKQFQTFILPNLALAKRGTTCTIPLYKVFNYILKKLHTGCQWRELAIDPHPQKTPKPELSWQSVYHHFSKWTRLGCLKHVFEHSIRTIQSQLDLSNINLDGSHTIAKKGGNAVAYQARKRAKTSNILPITDRNGFVLATTAIIAGNHNDAFELSAHLKAGFKSIQQLGIKLRGTFFNADAAFDTRDARKLCFNRGIYPNIPTNLRNRKRPKPGPKRLFSADIYKRRALSERTFAWIDKFRGLLIRFERCDQRFLAAHFIAFAMINLRHLIALN